MRSTCCRSSVPTLNPLCKGKTSPAHTIVTAASHANAQALLKCPARRRRFGLLRRSAGVADDGHRRRLGCQSGSGGVDAPVLRPTLLFVALAFRRLHLVPQVCEPGAPCAEPRTVRCQRLMFWLAVIVLAGLLAVPWMAPLFYCRTRHAQRLAAAVALVIPVTVLAGGQQTAILNVQNMT